LFPTCSHGVPIKFPKFLPKTFKEDGNIKTKNQGCSCRGRVELVEMVRLMIIIIALNNRNLSLTNKEKY
jgi:hypothetical protein